METNILLEQASEHVKKVNKLMGQVEDFETVLNEVNTDDSTVCIYSKKETIFVDGVLNPNIMSGLKVTRTNINLKKIQSFTSQILRLS